MRAILRLLTLLCVVAAGTTALAQRVGQAAPEIEALNQLNATDSVSLEKYKGKIIVLFFWRTTDSESVDALTGAVHERFGLEQDHPVAAQPSLGELALELASPGPESVILGDPVHRHEADVVPVLGVFCARVAEADEELQGERPVPIRLTLAFSCRELPRIASPGLPEAAQQE